MMSTATEAKHTPGPWTWRNVPSAGIQISAFVPTGARVGLHTYTTESDDGGTGMLFSLREPQEIQLADERWVQFCNEDWRAMQEANARLIAAAPELLEACRECAEWLDLVRQNYPDMAGLIRGMQSARDAIAKAEAVN